jgi:hypothetical protein
MKRRKKPRDPEMVSLEIILGRLNRHDWTEKRRILAYMLWRFMIDPTKLGGPQ